MPKLNKFYVFTFSGEGGPVAKKLKEEGQDVTLAMIEDNADILTKEEKHTPEDKEEKAKRMSLMDGLVRKVSAKKAVKELLSIPQKDRASVFVYNDFNHNFKYAEQLVGKDFQGNFPTEEDRRMEVSRDLAKEFVQKHYKNLKVAEVQEFKSAQDGIKFLEETSDVWCLKGKDEDAKTVVPDTKDPQLANNQVIEALENESKSYEKSGYILERMIPDMAEFTPEIQFYNGKPLFTTMDIELKRLGAGDNSIMTGCGGDLIFPTEMDAEINTDAFPKIVHDMAKAHQGWFIWDASILIDKSTGEKYFGEFCPNRLGYNAFYTELCLAGSATEFFNAIANGKNPYSSKMGFYGASVRVFNMQTPKATEANDMGDRMIEVSEDVEDYIWLMDAKAAEKENEDEESEVADKYYTTGYSWDLAVATGEGESPKEAAQNAYAYLEGLSFRGKYFRPEQDWLSVKYPSSIMSRFKYGVDNGLF